MGDKSVMQRILRERKPKTVEILYYETYPGLLDWKENKSIVS